MRWLVVVVLSFAACVSSSRPDAPAVHVIPLRAVQGDTPALDPLVVTAIVAWEPLGFDVSADDTGTRECDLHWHAGDPIDCQITIGVIRPPDLIEREDKLAESNRDQRIVWIDARLVSPRYLSIASAHEAGHVLLDTPRHTEGGIMGGFDDVMHDVDRALACETVGLCVERP